VQTTDRDSIEEQKETNNETSAVNTSSGSHSGEEVVLDANSTYHRDLDKMRELLFKRKNIIGRTRKYLGEPHNR